MVVMSYTAFPLQPVSASAGRLCVKPVTQQMVETEEQAPVVGSIMLFSA